MSRKIESIANVNSPKLFWNVVKSCKPRPRQVVSPSLDTWNEFLRTSYPPRVELENDFAWQFNPLLDAPITVEELLGCVAKAKVGKAPGVDNIPSEFYKALPEEWMSYLLGMFNKILLTGVLPKEWSRVTLCMIHKKGNANDPLNYRGIALVNIVTKIFTQIIHDRLEKWTPAAGLVQEELAGF